MPRAPEPCAPLLESKFQQKRLSQKAGAQIRREVALACHHLATKPELRHGHVEGHPEAPERLSACIEHLTAAGLWSRLHRLRPRTATLEELGLCHASELLAGLELAAAAAKEAGTPLCLPATGLVTSSEDLLSSGDTFVTEGSWESARSSCGGLLVLVDKAFEPGSMVRHGFALCRPPGHHAGAASSTGFCLVNNVAIAAAYARKQFPLKCRRILIFDWDVHHGQGTQQIFWQDRHVLFVSAHKKEAGFYPGTGRPEEVGAGDGEGFTINVSLPPGYGDADLWSVCREVLVPAARSFRPHLILVSAGFDAAEGDPVGECSCTPRGFGSISQQLAQLAEELCGGRLLLALEGGYNRSVLGECIVEVLEGLLIEPRPPGKSEPFAERPEWMGVPSDEAAAAISATLVAHRDLALGLIEGDYHPADPAAEALAALRGAKKRRLSSPEKPVLAEGLLQPQAEALGEVKAASIDETVKLLAPGAAAPVLCFDRDAWNLLTFGQKDRLKVLGAQLQQTWSPAVSHVVVSSLRRTARLLCGICAGQHIVTMDWVKACLAAGRWVAEAGFLKRDLALEVELGVTMPEALARARKQPLLEGISVQLAAGLRPEVRHVARCVISAAGGELLEGVPTTMDFIALDSRQNWKAKRRRSSEESSVARRFAIELLFEGALIQELRWAMHRL